MAETIADLSREIAALKEALYNSSTSSVTAKYDGDHQEKDESKKPQEKSYPVSELKKALIDSQPKIVTDAMLPFEFIKRFAEMYEELQKEKSSELLEAFGLDGLGAAVEKFHEDHESKWSYFWSAIAGLLVPLMAGALILTISAAMLKLQRAIQAKLFGGRVVARNDEGTGFGLQSRTHVNNRENAAAGAVLTNPPDTTAINNLKQALGEVNQRIKDFNTAVSKMKSASALNKLAEGVDKLTKATDAAKPTDIETLATAIGKLGTAQDTFAPKKLPKAQTLSAAATQAERLAKAGGEVKTAFDNLKAAAQAAERVIAAG
ncbi:hypothetical protein ACFV0D_16820 [Streptomyces sp. NPDC059556]|uniref:hypothetical protein n=1 Tax=Streptomyces sp. NPDC059556 TaxID=3346863 RepID=UPI0036933E0F